MPNLATSPAPAGSTDKVALEELYVALERPLTNVLYRWLWDREDVRDVIQESFVRLWQMRSKVDWQRAEALVYRIAVNLASNKRRSRKTWQWISFDDNSSQRDAIQEQELLRSENHRLARAALDTLSEKHRRVLVLSFCSDLTQAEIADVLATSPGTVASRKNAALTKLRRVLEPRSEV